MEERLEAPSIVSTSLSASADPRGVSAAQTRRLSTSDRAMCHAVPVTFKHDACAPLCSSAGLRSSASATTASRLAARGLAAARCPSLVGDGLPSSASAERGGLRVAGLPSCGLPCGRARSANPMRSTDFCFPMLRLRTPVPRVAPGSSPRLAPRPFARGLAPWMTETGGPGVSRRPIRFGGSFGVGARRASSACSRSDRTSGIPVAAPSDPSRSRAANRTNPSRPYRARGP